MARQALCGFAHAQWPMSMSKQALVQRRLLQKSQSGASQAMGQALYVVEKRVYVCVNVLPG